MSEPTLTQMLQGVSGRVSALEDDQTQADGLSRIVKVYGSLRITVTLRWSKYQFRVCSDSLACSDSLII